MEFTASLDRDVKAGADVDAETNAGVYIDVNIDADETDGCGCEFGCKSRFEWWTGVRLLMSAQCK